MNENSSSFRTMRRPDRLQALRLATSTTVEPGTPMTFNFSACPQYDEPYAERTTKEPRKVKKLELVNPQGFAGGAKGCPLA